jgi:hypothetical protein
MKCFECGECIHFELVKGDTNEKNKVFSCSNTDRHCYERLQFFNDMITKLKELREHVRADLRELKRNPEMISECVGRLSTLTFTLELFGEEEVITSNYQCSNKKI